jgi:hypothetical protein
LPCCPPLFQEEEVPREHCRVLNVVSYEPHQGYTGTISCHQETELDTLFVVNEVYFEFLVFYSSGQVFENRSQPCR